MSPKDRGSNQANRTAKHTARLSSPRAERLAEGFLGQPPLRGVDVFGPRWRSHKSHVSHGGAMRQVACHATSRLPSDLLRLALEELQQLQKRGIVQNLVKVTRHHRLSILLSVGHFHLADRLLFTLTINQR